MVGRDGVWSVTTFEPLSSFGSHAEARMDDCISGRRPKAHDNEWLDCIQSLSEPGRASFNFVRGGLPVCQAAGYRISGARPAADYIADVNMLPSDAVFAHALIK